MSTAIMNPTVPHRKPLPKYAQPAPYNNQPPLQQQQHMQQSTSYQNAAAGMYPQASAPVADRTRSITSMASHQQHYQQQQPTQYPPPMTRRTLSNGTSSTSSTSTNTNLQRAPTNPGINAQSPNAPRRSTSSRSTSSASPTSYVALMRKQKATVWCDRAQHEDPRILAAQRAAKNRAAKEVAGGAHHGVRVSSSSNNVSGSMGIRSKIRHHGAPKASTYTGQANLSGAGVPMRLSASEVDENDSDEEGDSRYVKYHQRNGSGRSSLNSGHRGQYGGGAQQYLHSGSGVTPPTGHSPVGSMGDLVEEDTPVPEAYGQQAKDYFDHSGGNGGSGSSGEAEKSFGGIGGLPQSSRGQTAAEKERKTSEELRRRGSVDDRTMTMSGVRLFVANPDLSD